MQMLSIWQNKANEGWLIGTKQYDPELIAIIEENERLKRALKVAQEERETLKRQLAYLVNEER